MCALIVAILLQMRLLSIILPLHSSFSFLFPPNHFLSFQTGYQPTTSVFSSFRRSPFLSVFLIFVILDRLASSPFFPPSSVIFSVFRRFVFVSPFDSSNCIVPKGVSNQHQFSCYISTSLFNSGHRLERSVRHHFHLHLSVSELSPFLSLPHCFHSF